MVTAVMVIMVAMMMMMIYDMIYIFNCKWVDTWWQQYSYIYTQTVHRIQRTKHT